VINMVSRTNRLKTPYKGHGQHIVQNHLPLAVPTTEKTSVKDNNPALSYVKNLKKLNLSEIIDKQNLKPILEDMARITGTSVAILDLNGKTVFATAWQEICTKFHRTHPETKQNCMESDSTLHAHVEDGTIQICKCKNNMQDVSTPIIIGNKRLGSLVIGQFLFDDDIFDKNLFISQARKYGFDEKAYLSALDKVPRYNRGKIYELMHFYSKLIKLISSLSISNAELANTLIERDVLLNSLQESENKYRLLVENLQEGILRINNETKILFVNSRMAEMLDYSKSEMLGKQLYSFMNNRKGKINKISLVSIKKSIKAQHDLEFIRRDGSRLYAMLSSTPIMDNGSGLIEAIIGVQDITERKLAEEALAEEAFRRRILFEQSRDGIVVMDENGKVYEANQQFADMLGYSLEEIRSLYVWDWDTQWQRQQLMEMIRTVNEKGDHFETYHRRKDGTTVDVEISSNGAFIGGKKLILCVCRDITKRKLVEQAVQQSENKLKSVFNTAPIGIGITNNLIIKEMNNQLCEITGYTREELLGKNVRILFDSEEHFHTAKDETTIKLSKKGIATFEARSVRKDGKIIQVLINLAKLDTSDPTSDSIFTVLDITERKNTEEALQQDEAKLKSIFETAPTGIGITVDRVFTELNPTFCDITGYSKQELIGKNSRILYQSDRDYTEIGLRLDKLIAQNGTATVEGIYKRKDGTLINVLIKGTVVNYDNSTTARVFTIVDITEQKMMEKALRDSAEQMETTFSHMQTGIIIIDAETHKIVDVNPVAVELIGTEKENIIGRKCHKFICPSEFNKCPITDLGQIIDRSERELIKNNGERIPILKSVTSFSYKSRKHLIENFIDISERKKIDDERQRVEKLESIGLLAGGIAHDFNNILTGILGNISLAKMTLKPDTDIYDIIQDAEKASLKAKDLTHQLLTFSRGGAPVMKTTSISEILEHTATFVLRGSNVRCTFSIPDDLWNAEIDEGQISQVINNLIINAQQSMPGGGLIELIAENIDDNDRHGLDTGLPLKNTKYIKITVKDHGIGIPQDHLAKIFDPFFTTKQKGSGLGLATSYSIIRRHNGYINVSSRIGEGTTFYVYLPATENKTVQKKTVNRVYSPGIGRLLVMDDEEIVRQVAKRTLKFMGYENVDFAVDGAEVIEFFNKARSEGNPYTLIILDLTVPGGMGGEETMKELLKIDPEVNVIVSSGYSNEPVMSEYKKYGFKGAVIKPYTIEQLQKAIHSIMAKNGQ
jgi:PAS domain S-box-containing protein